jgi:hypothetical protein
MAVRENEFNRHTLYSAEKVLSLRVCVGWRAWEDGS